MTFKPLNIAGFVAAISIAVSGMASAGNEPAINLSQAGQMVAQQQYSEAIGAYTQILDSETANTEDRGSAYFQRGIAEQEIGMTGHAIADFTQAIWLGHLDNKELATAHFRRGKGYSLLKQYSRAITDFDRAIQLEPAFAQAYSLRGDAYRNRGIYKLALQDYSTSIRLLNPDLHLPYFGRGLTHEAMGNQRLAAADFRRATELNPEFSLATARASKGVDVQLAAVSSPVSPNPPAPSLVEKASPVEEASPVDGGRGPVATAAIEPSATELSARVSPPLPIAKTETTLSEPDLVETPRDIETATSAQEVEVAAAEITPQEVTTNSAPEQKMDPSPEQQGEVQEQQVDGVSRKQPLKPSTTVAARTDDKTKTAESLAYEAKAKEAALRYQKSAASSSAVAQTLQNSAGDKTSAVPATVDGPIVAAAPVSKATNSNQKSSDVAIEATGAIPDEDRNVSAAEIRAQQTASAIAANDDNSPVARNVAPSAKAEVPLEKVAAVSKGEGAAGRFLVQIASYREKDDALRRFDKLSGLHKDLLSGLTPDVLRADLGAKGVYFRLRIGPFQSFQSSTDLCNALKQRQLDCLVIQRKNAG